MANARARINPPKIITRKIRKIGLPPPEPDWLADGVGVAGTGVGLGAGVGVACTAVAVVNAVE